MQVVLEKLYKPEAAPVLSSHIDAMSSRRAAVEAFIKGVFERHYGAKVSSFAPNLMLLEQQGQIVAATGWRSAKSNTLFLERYLDTTIEDAMAQLADQRVKREHIVEVGNLAAEKAGGSLHVILSLASHLDRLGYEWVVFTATQELIGIFSRLGLPLLALAKADSTRLGDAAQEWGSYYDTEPIIVAGRIHLAIERLGRP